MFNTINPIKALLLGTILMAVMAAGDATVGDTAQDMQPAASENAKRMLIAIEKTEKVVLEDIRKTMEWVHANKGVIWTHTDSGPFLPKAEPEVEQLVDVWRLLRKTNSWMDTKANAERLAALAKVTEWKTRNVKLIKRVRQLIAGVGQPCLMMFSRGVSTETIRLDGAWSRVADWVGAIRE